MSLRGYHHHHRTWFMSAGAPTYAYRNTCNKYLQQHVSVCVWDATTYIDIVDIVYIWWYGEYTKKRSSYITYG